MLAHISRNTASTIALNLARIFNNMFSPGICVMTLFRPKILTSPVSAGLTQLEFDRGKW